VAGVLRPPVRVDGIDHLVSASIGITYATLGRPGQAGGVTADLVLQDADVAMYRAKDLGKDRFEVFKRAPGGPAPAQAGAATPMRAAANGTLSPR
jgi:predicted signal transduction protein with EAL and GGDEF domain